MTCVLYWSQLDIRREAELILIPYKAKKQPLVPENKQAFWNLYRGFISSEVATSSYFTKKKVLLKIS